MFRLSIPLFWLILRIEVRPVWRRRDPPRRRRPVVLSHLSPHLLRDIGLGPR